MRASTQSIFWLQAEVFQADIVASHYVQLQTNVLLLSGCNDRHIIPAYKVTYI
jgi:hypothetical protein